MADDVHLDLPRSRPLAIIHTNPWHFLDPSQYTLCFLFCFFEVNSCWSWCHLKGVLRRWVAVEAEAGMISAVRSTSAVSDTGRTRARSSRRSVRSVNWSWSGSPGTLLGSPSSSSKMRGMQTTQSDVWMEREYQFEVNGLDGSWVQIWSKWSGGSEWFGSWVAFQFEVNGLDVWWVGIWSEWPGCVMGKNLKWIVWMGHGYTNLKWWSG